MKTDQQINRSTDSAPGWKWVVCLLVGWLAAAGCEEASVTAVSTTKATAVSGGSTEPARSSTPTIEAGIVLADRAGYFCLPIEQIGLPPDAEIVSLKSSCECIQPRVVQYVADRQQIGQAILLEYIPEVPSSGSFGKDTVSESQPANLGVMVEVGLADGTKLDFTVKLLHSLLRNSAKSEPTGTGKFGLLSECGSVYVCSGFLVKLS